MKKILSQLLLSALMMSLYGCHGKPAIIKPIDEEFNKRLMSLTGMNANLMGTKLKFQYFEISGIEKMDAKAVKLFVDQYLEKKYPAKLITRYDQLTFLFYKPSLFSNYSDKLYISARDEEEGRIQGEQGNLVITVSMERLKTNRWEHRFTSYSDKPVVDIADTILIAAGENKGKQSSNATVGQANAIVENNSCLRVVNKSPLLSFQRCFEIDFIRVNAVKDNKLSLTFVSGKNAIDITFYPSPQGWLATESRFFGQQSANKNGVTRKAHIKLEDFEFSQLAEATLNKY